MNEIPLTNRHNKKKEKVGQAVSVSRGIEERSTVSSYQQIED